MLGTLTVFVLATLYYVGYPLLCLLPFTVLATLYCVGYPLLCCVPFIVLATLYCVGYPLLCWLPFLCLQPFKLYTGSLFFFSCHFGAVIEGGVRIHITFIGSTNSRQLNCKAGAQSAMIIIPRQILK